MNIVEDPLLLAVIGKLPPASSGFSADGRTKWLRMMAMAFDVTYGETGAVEIPDFLSRSAAADAQTGSGTVGGEVGSAASQTPSRPKPVPHVAAGFDYYIDLDGFARCDTERGTDGRPIPTPQRQVDPGEIGGDDVIYDYRSPRNRESIIWADGTMGGRPGQSFGGPG